MIGRRLKQARKAAGLTQDDLAERAEMDSAASSISHYENETHNPPFSLVCKFAEALDIPECWFYCRDDKLAQLIIDNHRENREFRLDPDEILQLRDMGGHLDRLTSLVAQMLKKRNG
ncbi:MULTISPECIES: helix-turn-helix domain-containing protein [Serratia]|uniref:helix-turn-helix domain-containing protein n=1 Tax=Serratia TaxID=613 RepID=UPI00080B4506